MGKRPARQVFEYDSMADFQDDGGPSAYGDGPVQIGKRLFFVKNGKLSSTDKTTATRSICLIGDSYTSWCSSLWGPPSKRPFKNIGGNPLQGLTSNFTNLSIISGIFCFNFSNNVVGAGTLYWNNTDKTIQLQATGDIVGQPTKITGAGFYTAYSGDGVRCVYFGVINGIPNTPDAASSFNVADYTINERNPLAMDFNYYRSPALWATGLNDNTGIRTIYNLGISGDSPGGVLQRIDDVFECDADFNWLRIGINNTAQLASTKSIVDQLASAGGVLIVELLSPAVGKTINQYNSELSAYILKNHPDVYVVDVDDYLYDITSNTVDADKFIEPAASALHPNGYASYLIGKRVNPILERLSGYSGGSIRPNVADVYNSVTNPKGNLIVPGRFVGSVAPVGGPFSGQVGSGLSFSGNSGVTGIAIAASKVAYSDGIKGDYQRFTLTNPNSVNQSGTVFYNGSGINVGDELMFRALIQIKNAINLNQLYFRLADSVNFAWSITANANLYATPGSSATPMTVPADMGNDWVLITMTEPLIVPVGASSSFKFGLTMGLANTADATAQINIDYVDFRKQ